MNEVSAPTPGAAGTTAYLLARLQRHYIKPGDVLPGGMLIPEVTYGRQGGSRCDALYVGFTATSGRILIGHEIKATRADWLRELAKPGKADAWADQCHAWYVVAPAVDVVKPEELPPGWGLMVPTPGATRTRLTVKVRATVHEDRQPSWTACLSVLSRVDTLRAKAAIDAKEEARRQANVELDKLRAAMADFGERNEPDTDRLRGQLAAVEKALGARLDFEGRGTRNHLTLADLERVGKTARAGRQLHELAEMWAQPWDDVLAHTRQRLDRLVDALEAVKKVAQGRDCGQDQHDYRAEGSERTA